MRNLLTLIISLVCFNAFSQETITVAQAKDFVGKEVFLTGKVAGTKPMTSKVGNPLLLLDIDKVYPDNEMTIVIFHEVLEKGKFTEATLQNKSVRRNATRPLKTRKKLYLCRKFCSKNDSE